MNEIELKFQDMIERDKKILLNQKEISKLYQSSNTIFHYTKMKTAINHILPNLSLRLPSKKHSNFRKENDPFENQKIFCNKGGFLPQSDKERNLFHKRVAKITKIIEKYINSDIRMISFCMNDSHEDSIDGLGFNKPRMWAQYGNNFKGICIALKLDKLIEHNKLDKDDNIYHNKVKYAKFEEIWRNKPRLNYSEFMDINSDDTIVKNILDREIDNIIFTKHKDFEDENEYRICHFTKDEYSHLNISDSILGLIVNSHKINPVDFSFLLTFTKKYNLIFTENDWSDLNLHNWHIVNEDNL